MARIDLHSHSTASDGSLSPAALVARASANGARMLALTDHDDVSGLAEARVAARDARLPFVDGVEVSVTWQGRTLHVVGLGIDPGNEGLAAALRRIRDDRDARAAEIAARFDALGIEGTLEGARRECGNPALVSRTHFARHLVRTRRVRDMRAAFDRFLGAGRPACVPQRGLPLEDSVALIVGAGGKAVLAHPGRYELDGDGVATLFAAFVESGGAAVEVVCAGHTRRDVERYAAAAVRFGLAGSTGSDFHAVREGRFDVGGVPGLPPGVRAVAEALVLA